MPEERILVDPETSREWVEVAQGARVSRHIFVNVTVPAKDSNFARARELYPFEAVDERGRAYIGAALEHLIMWADYVAPFKFHPEQETNFQQRPPYTLARAALEASAQAVWMLDTRDPIECIRRHLSLVRWDLQEHMRSKQTPAERHAVEERDHELVKRVSNVFTEDLIRPPPGYLWVLRQACQAHDLNLQADHVERLWRAASGSAHGMYWPTQDLQTLVELRAEDGEIRQVRVADAHGIAEVLQAAYTMTQYAVLKFADFAGADIWSLMRAGRAWLESEITLREGAAANVVERLNGEGEPTVG
jgi:hypothetical protein